MNYRSLLAILLPLSGALAHAATNTEVVTGSVIEMHGFQVDFRLASEKQKAAVIPSLNKQLEIVDSVGLPAKVLEFFHTVPVVIDPDLTAMYGQYMPLNGTWIVRVKPAKLPEDRPIVLHELLHAYHHQVLKQPTPEVGQAYAQALRSNMYPDKYRKAHFMENGKEYFAVIGSIFLFGKSIDQPPFDCAIPRRAQPDFLAFLEAQFGPHQCR